MIIGNFTYDEKADTYYGEIHTFTLQRNDVVIRPSGMNGEREPAYRVVLQTQAGDFELGAAWRKTSDRGAPYLSITLDDPAFPARCDAALFTDAGERTARLVWQRPKAKAAPQAATQPDRPAQRTRKRGQGARPSA